jgi:hypothetical protein
MVGLRIKEFWVCFDSARMLDGVRIGDCRMEETVTFVEVETGPSTPVTGKLGRRDTEATRRKPGDRRIRSDWRIVENERTGETTSLGSGA